MFVLLIADFPVAAAVDRSAVDLEPRAHGLQAFHLRGRNGAVSLRADVNEEVTVAADHLDHLVHDIFDALVLIAFEVAKGSAEGGAALPLGADDFHFQVILLKAADAIGPVALPSLVVDIDGLAACRTMVHEAGDHAA